MKKKRANKLTDHQLMLWAYIQFQKIKTHPYCPRDIFDLANDGIWFLFPHLKKNER